MKKFQCVFSAQSTRSAISGFTLIELIIVTLVFGVLTSIAVPEFSSLIKSSRFNRGTDNFRSAIDFSRTTALSTSTTVAMCPSENPNAPVPACSAATEKNYEDGWIIYKDCNSNSTFDGASIICDDDHDGTDESSELLRTQIPLNDIVIESSTATRLVFDQVGRANSLVSFNIDNDIFAYTLTVNTLGRIAFVEVP
jgi:type IV fimbrial biogenesis protein FimT